MDELFAPGGRLAAVFPSFEPRPQPAAAAALGRDVRVAVIKGRENYLCRKSLHGLELLRGSAGALLADADDAATLEGLRGWIESTETGDRAELPFEPSASLWAEVAVGSDRCTGRRCPFLGTCFAEAARERAGAAELVIANHALYFADLALRGRTDGAGILPEHDAVVFDEAHRLEDAAASWLGGRISLAGLRRLGRDARDVPRRRGSRPRLLGRAGRARLGAGRRLRRPAGDALGERRHVRSRLRDARAALPARAPRARRGARGRLPVAVRLPRAGARLRPCRVSGAARSRLLPPPRRRGRRAVRALARPRARPHLVVPGARRAGRAGARALALPAPQAGRGAA